MTTTTRIVSDLAAAGIALSLTPARKIRASGPLTDAIRQTIRDNRDAIAAALERGEGSPPALTAPARPPPADARARAAATPTTGTDPHPPTAGNCPRCGRRQAITLATEASHPWLCARCEADPAAGFVALRVNGRALSTWDTLPLPGPAAAVEIARRMAGAGR